MANNNKMNQVGELIGIADVLFAETAANDGTPNALNGSVTINLGSAESGELQSARAEVWSVPGIIAVPSLPVKTNNNTDAAQALYYTRNDQNIAFAFRDTRTQDKAGNPNPGETVVYATGGKGRTAYKNDDSITTMTTDADGQAIYFRISPTGMYFVAPFGNFTFDASGVHFNTKSGASFNMGGVPGIPAPFDTLVGNFCNITAASTTISSPFLTLGDGMNAPFISSAMPLTITAPVINLGGVAINIGDVTTPSAVTVNSAAFTVLATAAISMTAVGAVSLNAGLAITATAAAAVAITALGAIALTSAGAIPITAPATIFTGTITSPLNKNPLLIAAGPPFILPG